MKQRRNSIFAILRKSGSCVTEHLGLKGSKSYVSLAIDFNGVLGGVSIAWNKVDSLTLCHA